MNGRKLLRPISADCPLQWSEAVRPAPDVQFTPAVGYRPDVYINPTRDFRVPALAVSVDRGRMLDIFAALTTLLGDRVDMILETSHFRSDGKHRDFRRLGVPRAAAISYVSEFEDLICDDGCTGVAMIAPAGPFEVQLDEHKTIVVYAPKRRPFAAICREFGLTRDDQLPLISEVRHVHRSHAEFAVMFRDLTRRLGMSRG